MPASNHTPRIHAAILASLLSTAIVSGAAIAQEPSTTTNNTAEATTNLLHYSLGAAPLSQVLSQFASQAGILLSADGAITQGINSPGLNGQYSIDQALRKLLEGSGIRFVRSGNTVTLTNDEVMTLNPVEVGGAAIPESAYGPVDGYVAARSATATKSSTKIIDTPRSISVVTRDEMDQHGVESISDALGYTAGVVADAFGDEGRYDEIYVRGFKLSANGIFIDDLKMGAPPSEYFGTKIDPYGLERVELLKGPSSILYGQINPGGLINSITKRPTADSFLSTEFQYGSYSKKRAAIDLGGPISDNKQWLGRLTALVQESDTQHDFGRNDRIYIAPAISWQPSDKTNWTFLANYQRDEHGPYPGFLPSLGTLDPNPNGIISTARTTGEPGDIDETEQYSISSLLEHRFSDRFSFKQNFRYTSSSYDNEAIFGWGLESDNRTINRGYYLVYSDVSNFVMDNQLEMRLSTGAISHTVIAGIDYRHSKETLESGYASAPSLDIFAPVYNTPFINLDTYTEKPEQTQTGIYLQEQTKVGDELFISLGGRWDRATNNADTSTSGSKTKDNAFTWSAGLLYKTRFGLSPYLSYAESFMPEVGVDYITGKLFGPSTGKQYELGLKWLSTDERSLVTLSTFKLIQDNSLSAMPGIRGKTQNGEIESSGLEIEGKFQIGEPWVVTASYAYLDSEYSRDNELQGLEVQQAPRHLASVWAHYKNLLPGLSVGAGARHVARRVYGYEGKGSPSVNELYLSSRTLLDFNAEYVINKFTVSLDARNLTNKETFSCYSEGYGYCVPDDGRELSIKLRYDY